MMMVMILIDVTDDDFHLNRVFRVVENPLLLLHLVRGEQLFEVGGGREAQSPERAIAWS